MKITFRQIDAFQTLISSGTVTKTASLLEISQPAVSRLISDLEKGAGFKLFKKIYTGGSITVLTKEYFSIWNRIKRAIGVEK